MALTGNLCFVARHGAFLSAEPGGNDNFTPTTNTRFFLTPPFSLITEKSRPDSKLTISLFFQLFLSFKFSSAALPHWISFSISDREHSGDSVPSITTTILSVNLEQTIYSQIFSLYKLPFRRQPNTVEKMSAGAKQRLMSEYRALEKEDWVQIEVCDVL